MPTASVTVKRRRLGVAIAVGARRTSGSTMFGSSGWPAHIFSEWHECCRNDGTACERLGDGLPILDGPMSPEKPS